MLYNGSYATPRPDLGEAYKEYMAEPDTYIANQVAPEFPVDVPEGSYSAITRESMLKSADDSRAENGSYNRIIAGAEDKTFKTYDRGLEYPVDYRKRSKHQKDFDLDMIATEQIVNRVKLNREIRWKAKIFDTAVWTGASLFLDVSGAAPWDSAANGKPITDVAFAKLKVWQNTGMVANALILGYTQLQNLLVNAQILARFPGAAVVTEEMLRSQLAAIFGLQKLIVGKAVKNTADEGQDATNAEVWHEDYVSVARVAEQNAPVGTPCVARSQRWTVESPDEIVMEQYIEPQTRQDIIRGRNDMGESIQDKFMAFLLQVDPT